MTGMEDVLAAHEFVGFDDDYGDLHCKCKRSFEASEVDPDSREPHAAHVAEALALAGFGNLHDAWAEGVATALNNAIDNDDGMTLRLEHLDGRPWANPYPKVSES